MENEFIAGRKNKINKTKEIDPEFSHSKEQVTRNFFFVIRQKYGNIFQSVISKVVPNSV